MFEVIEGDSTGGTVTRLHDKVNIQLSQKDWSIHVVANGIVNYNSFIYFKKSIQIDLFLINNSRLFHEIWQRNTTAK